MPVSFRCLGRLAVLAYLYGAVLGVLALLWDVAFREGPPKWAWWQYALAPFGIGLFVLGSGWLVEKLQTTTGFGQSGVSRGRHALQLVILFIVLASLIIGPAVYKMAYP